MTATLAKQVQAIARFHELHESGCFVIPNPWDRGTAVYLERAGFKALATTSAGLSFSRALPDEVKSISRDTMIEHIGELVAATSVPVNADFQNGYADDPEMVAENVALCIATGVAGLSIEDATGNDNQPLYEEDLALERVKAARAAIDRAQREGERAVLTARCEAFLVGDENPFQTAMKRLSAFAEAGADCLFAPGVKDPHQIEAIVKAVAPKPVNVLMSSPAAGLSVERLAELGVRRISVGSALARVAWGALIRAATSIIERGSFDCLADAASFAELNELFSRE